jgi:hypothetical protein
MWREDGLSGNAPSQPEKLNSQWVEIVVPFGKKLGVTLLDSGSGNSEVSAFLIFAAGIAGYPE